MKTPKTYAERKQAAFNAGQRGFIQGVPVAQCPILKHKGLAQSWKEGWLAASADQQKRTSGMFIAKEPAAATASSGPGPGRQQPAA